MSGLMELIKVRQGDVSNEKYANLIGLTGVSLWRYHNDKSEINLEAIQKLGAFFANNNDPEMVGALAAYALGLPVDNTALGAIGETVLKTLKNPTPSV